MSCISFLWSSQQVTKNWWLETIESYCVSQFWRPEVRNQGVRKAVLLQRLRGGGGFLLASSGVWRLQASACDSATPFSASVSTWRLPGCLCTTPVVGLGPMGPVTGTLFFRESYYVRRDFLRKTVTFTV